MKIRNGFISNSSSSSFVICKKILTDDQLIELDKWLVDVEAEFPGFKNVYIDHGTYLYVNFYNYSWLWFEFVEKNNIPEEDILYFDPDEF